MTWIGMRASQARGISSAASTGRRSRHAVVAMSTRVVPMRRTWERMLIGSRWGRRQGYPAASLGSRLEHAQEALREVGDVVIAEQVIAAALAHRLALLRAQDGQLLDRVGDRGGVARRDAESRARLGDGIVGRVAEEDDRAPRREIVGELVEADAVAIQGQVAQPVDECIRQRHRGRDLRLGYRRGEIHVVEAEVLRPLDDRVAVLARADEQQLDVAAAALLQLGGRVEDGLQRVGGDETAEEHDAKRFARDAVVLTEPFVSAELDAVRDPDDALAR